MGSENCAELRRVELRSVELRGVRSLRLRRHVLPVDGVARRQPDGGAGGGARDKDVSNFAIVIVGGSSSKFRVPLTRPDRDTTRYTTRANTKKSAMLSLPRARSLRTGATVHRCDPSDGDTEYVISTLKDFLLRGGSAAKRSRGGARAMPLNLSLVYERQGCRANRRRAAHDRRRQPARPRRRGVQAQGERALEPGGSSASSASASRAARIWACRCSRSRFAR